MTVRLDSENATFSRPTNQSPLVPGVEIPVLANESLRRIDHIVDPRWTRVLHDAQGEDGKFASVIHLHHPRVQLTETERAIFATDEMQALLRRCQMPVCYTSRAEATGSVQGPGFEHSRGHHCVHALEIANEICRRNRLSSADSALVRLATGIHDIGHIPLSHSTEAVLQRLQHNIDVVELFGGPEMVERISELAHPGVRLPEKDLVFDHDLHGAFRVLTSDVGEILDEEGRNYGKDSFTKEDVLRLLFDENGLGRLRDEADRIAYLRLDYLSTHFPPARLSAVQADTQDLINCLYVERPEEGVRADYRVWLRDDWVEKSRTSSAKPRSAMMVFDSVMGQRIGLFTEYSLCPARLVMDEYLQIVIGEAITNGNVSVHELLRMSDRSLIERFSAWDQRLFGMGPHVERRGDGTPLRFDDYFVSERSVSAAGLHDPNQIRSPGLRAHLRSEIESATGLRYGEFVIGATYDCSKSVKANWYQRGGTRSPNIQRTFAPREEDQLLFVAVDRQVGAQHRRETWQVFDSVIADLVKSPRHILSGSPFDRHLDVRRFIDPERYAFCGERV